MQFFMPTKVYEGKGVLQAQAHVMKGLGSKAFIVTGKNSSKRNGSLKDVQQALSKEGICYALFDEIEENPSLETVEKASKIGREEKADFVIGIGGGSPLDAAKAIAIMMKHPNITKDTLIGTQKLDALPVVAVATTAGTGSEVTPYAILTDHQAKTKKNIGHLVFPNIAFLDATYMMDMPYDVTVHTAVDALSHLVESYLNTNTNPLSEAAVIKGLQLWGECILPLMKNQISYEVRQKLLLASTLGGIAIAQTGTSLPHGMGYALTYFKQVPHGLANGLLYKAYFACFKDQTRVQQLHKMLGLNSHGELEHCLEELCKIEIHLTREEIKAFASQMCQSEAKLKNHPEHIDYLGVYTIYERTFF